MYLLENVPPFLMVHLNSTVTYYIDDTGDRILDIFFLFCQYIFEKTLKIAISHSI